MPITKTKKIVLEEYEIWVGKDQKFDKSLIKTIKNPEYNFWGEIKKTKTRCKQFDDGTLGKDCNWYVAKVVTDTPKHLLVPEAVFRAQNEIRNVMGSTPKYVSFRGKGVRPFD